jgi:hypothetical protein
MIKSNGGIIGPDNVTTGGAFGTASGVFKLGEVTNLIKESKWPTAGPQGHQVANSCRFDDGSSDNLTRSNPGAGNVRTWTYSVWFKLSLLPAAYRLFSIGTGASGPIFSIFFTAGDLRIENDNASTNVLGFRTDQVFTDPGAWSLLVVACDTTQGTEANRFKIYHNGTQITSFSTSNYPAVNADTYVNGTTGSSTIGARAASPSNTYFDGYMSEVVIIDGQQLTPTSFGEFNSQTGIWVPKVVTGLTFGTNGFYQNYSNSGALGEDFSGEDNDFTVNNLTSLDQSTDTCSTNFATLNPLISKGNESQTQVLSQGNLTVAANQASWCHSRGTFGASSGKWYWEAKITGTMGNLNIGVSNAATNVFGGTVQSLSGNTSIYPNGQYNINGSITGSQSPTFSSGDICGVALNMDDNTVSFYKNGTILSWGTNLAISGGTDDVWLPASAVYKSDGASSPVIEFNFGSPPYAISSGNTDGNGFGNFEYAVPTGYLSLNTKNLAAVLA